MSGEYKPVEVSIIKLEQIHVPAVVKLHRWHLPYTVNSLLGEAHLGFLYELMRKDPASVVLVALINGAVAGVVSATLDPVELKNMIFSKMLVADWVKLFLRIVANPKAVTAWYKGRNVGSPVQCQDLLVVPCLTAIAVDSSFRQAGIGRYLVNGVEEFCRAHGQLAFRLDTVADNLVSRKFYQKLDFIEAEQRGENVMLVKLL